MIDEEITHDMQNVSSDLPGLSVILVTDTYERIEYAIETWRRQTMADRVELVLVTNAADELRSRTSDIGGFHKIQVVHTDSIDSLSPAGGVGVRQATAPFVFIAETHAYPDPRSVLLDFGDRLEHAITFGDELFLGLKKRGHKAYFDPSVAIHHVNLSRLGP